MYFSAKKAAFCPAPKEFKFSGIGVENLNLIDKYGGPTCEEAYNDFLNDPNGLADLIDSAESQALADCRQQEANVNTDGFKCPEGCDKSESREPCRIIGNTASNCGLQGESEDKPEIHPTCIYVCTAYAEGKLTIACSTAN